MLADIADRYTILSTIGEGGMGVVHEARDRRLDRRVAIKVLHPDALSDAHRRRRFHQEAKAASALNHPGIITIYDIETAGDVDFIVMEYVDGMPLQRAIPEGGLPLDRALDYGRQIASAVAAAHDAGIVHRDLKPANVMVTLAGQIKVLDFGLAKLTAGPDAPDSHDENLTVTASPATAAGVVVGTAAYMSPEQAVGTPVDARSDVFSFGVMFYEMLAGRRPFGGDTFFATVSALVNDPPPPLDSARRPVPSPVAAIVRRCLEKDPARRYANARELHDDLARAHALVTGTASVTPAARNRFRVAAIAALTAAVAAGVGGTLWVSARRARARTAIENNVAEIARLTAAARYYDAVRLARDVMRTTGDPRAARTLDSMTYPGSLVTTPPGAKVYLKEYADPDGAWALEGNTPLENARLPGGFLRWKVESPGYEPVEGGDWGLVTRLVLHRKGEAPAGMVMVAGGPRSAPGPMMDLPDFWIDRYEVTNRQFKQFVDAGGYRKPDFWTQPFERSGRPLAWQEAVALFLDQTGQPGPATWQLGSYPDGQADFPVRGVSWYEAAAYAEFAGKTLPTLAHWQTAAGTRDATIIAFSNFSNKGPAAAGANRDIGPYGTYQMTGNVKEWASTKVGDRRYILGGAWNEATYLAVQADARLPFDRSDTNGFRCVKYLAAPPASVLADVARPNDEIAKRTPVGDAEFELYRRLYGYDQTALSARVEAVEETEHWRRERVSFSASYGNERVAAQLYLPKNGRPPYQAVIWFGGGDVLDLPSSDRPGSQYLFDFVVRTGRVVVIPVFKGTYDRRLPPPGAAGPKARRELAIQQSNDLGRTIDYLETRPDIDRTRVAYYALSYGAGNGVLLVPLEPRVKAAVLLATGLGTGKPAPERDAVNFAPRLRVPTLMINGHDDFLFLVESQQKPLFELLGAPRDQKKHVVLEGVGHMPPPRADVIREVLAWFDTYLGPVERERR